MKVYVASVLLLVFFCIQEVSADDIRWAEPVGGDFASPERWLGGVAPGGKDTAIFEWAPTKEEIDISFLGDISNRALVAGSGSFQFILAGADYTLTDAARPIVVADGVGTSAGFHISGGSVAAPEGLAFVGISGHGFIRVVDGGRLLAANAYLGRNEGSSGDFFVVGDSSSIEITGHSAIGASGESTVSVGSDASFSGDVIDLGKNPGSTGRFIVSGPRARLDVGLSLTVGLMGDGTLEVGTDGVVETQNLSVGAQGEATGRVGVAERGALLSVARFFQIGALVDGDTASGSVLIEEGARAEAETCSIAPTSASSGQLFICDDQSSFDVGNWLSVGDDGEGKLHLVHGRVTVADIVCVGDDAGSQGTLTLEGCSVLESGAELAVGDDGNGTAEIRDDSIVRAQSAVIGKDPGGVGAVQVLGDAAQIELTEDLVIARPEARGRLEVRSGGRVSGRHLLLGAEGIVQADGVLDFDEVISEGQIGTLANDEEGATSQLRIDGDLTLSGGELHVHAMPAVLETTVAGQASLAGDLRVSFDPLHTFEIGDERVLLRAQSVSGRFARTSVSGLGALGVEVVYDEASVSIRFVETVSGFGRGDANADETRDISDAVFILEFLFQGGDTPECAV
ncbi:MAG: hypothetical protein AAF488_16085, partial [Planctomycetota bacterium]